MADDGRNTMSYQDRANAEKLDADIKFEEMLKKNRNFVMFFKGKSMSALAVLSRKSPNAMSILWEMVSRMNRQNAICISIKALMEITGYSRATVLRAIATLERESFIESVKVGNMNVYIMNSGVVWQTWGNTKHSVFNATVYATRNEQDETKKKKIDSGEVVELKHLSVVTVSPENKKPPKIGEIIQPELFE